MLTRRPEHNGLAAMLPDRRSALIFAVLLVLFSVGWRIPLPGIDLEQVVNITTYDAGSAARYSIFGHGLIPLFTVLLLFELVGLLVPRLDGWRADRVFERRDGFTTATLLALFLALAQGLAMAAALKLGNFADADAPAFRTTIIATYCAMTALTVWLAARFHISGLGGAFWLMMAISLVADLPSQAAQVIDVFRMDGLSGIQMTVVLLSVVAAIMLVVFANLLLEKNSVARAEDRAALLLWPPYIVGSISGWLITLFGSQFDWLWATAHWVDLNHAVLVLLLIPPLVFAYAVAARRRYRGKQPLGSTPTLIIVAAIQILICLATQLLPVYWELPLGFTGADIILIATVMLALRRNAPA